MRLVAGGRMPRCPALGPLNNCRAYDARPFICRAFGAVLPTLQCEHGCVTENGDFIESAESYRVLYDIERLSREVTGVARVPLPEDAR
jgi:Fe-S-cluster containining protein